jgi:hypothetical protein
LTTELLRGRRGKDSLAVHINNCTKHSVYATLDEAKCVRTAFYRVAVIFTLYNESTSYYTGDNGQWRIRLLIGWSTK